MHTRSMAHEYTYILTSHLTHSQCLDVRDGRVVKGVQFHGLRDAGDPVEQVIDDAICLFYYYYAMEILHVCHTETVCFH